MSENLETARDKILHQLPSTDAVRPPIWDEAAVPGDLVARFCERLVALGGQVKEMSDLPQAGVAYLDGDISIEGIETTNDVWNAECGITRAELGIGETGTVIVCSSSEHRRLASLAPPRHVVLLRGSDIVANLADAFARIPAGNVAMITGPSRTADIEGVLVRGVHGPKEIWVVLVNE